METTTCAQQYRMFDLHSRPAKNLESALFFRSICQSSTAVAAGNSNIVAIDNKIEQAMDLVKTHLLYAVREEVEILKVRIVELEKKVGNLEKENKILREYAPPEILAQLASSQPSPAILAVHQQQTAPLPQLQTPQLQQQQLQHPPPQQLQTQPGATPTAASTTTTTTSLL